MSRLAGAGGGRAIATAKAFFLAGALLAAAGSQPAIAQAPSIMAPGDAVVTGFAGTNPPAPPVLGDPLDSTFINLDGAAMRIQRFQPPGPPAGQLIPAPTVFSAPARTVGQVFAIALDDAPAPNIYLGASSAFGIQIVTPPGPGEVLPKRTRTGKPGAQFMAGQWGAGGAPGSIYRVDGTTGAITLFTTIGADSGPGIGDIVYDKVSRQYFVSDLDTGLIYRLDATGLLLDTFDHGLIGRPTRGLAPVADDNSAMNIADPGFDSENPATWGYTQKERRVWGMAFYAGRLFYAVADGPQVWSVGLHLDGTFANDPRWELDVSGLPSANPVSDILFDAQGRMILAQRGAQRGSYNYSVFAEPLQSSVVRYRPEIPDDPATPGTWVPVPEDYAIGFRPAGRNAVGGIALGYGYDTAGRLNRGACSQMLWSTGDSLRDNPALAAQLAAGGPAIVHGLQGNDVNLVRPANDPPFSSYFTDYDGKFDDPTYQGYVGDVEIWQPCEGSQGYYVPPYFPPPGYIPPGRFNLTLDKEATPYTCAPEPMGVVCRYTVRVVNTGSGPYWGPIVVDDWLPATPAGASIAYGPQPPWICSPVTPTEAQCAYPPVFLLPGTGIDLTVRVFLPAQRGQVCYLANGARLVWPAGLGDANPGDDVDVATAYFPDPSCPPPRGERTNLKVEKRAQPVCEDNATTWVCGYAVLVTNTGPGVYAGDIVVADTLSAAPSAIAHNPPWTCMTAGPVVSCTYPAAHLNPTQSVVLWLQVAVPKGLLKQLGECRVTNRAKIVAAAGGTPANFNAGDDQSLTVSATIPSEECRPTTRRNTDLQIYKVGAPGACVRLRTGPGWACPFAITIKNVGANPFNGIVTIKDTFVGFTPVPPSPVFVPGICAPDGGGGYDCTTPGPISIAPGATAGPLWVFVGIPDDGQTCKVTNRVRIVTPTGGSPQNTSALNDTAEATIEVPSQRCAPVAAVIQQQLVCPVERRMPNGGCCPDGQTWNGRACSGSPPPPPPPPQNPPQITCTGGTVSGNTCICPANTTRQTVGTNAFRCVGSQQPPPLVCTGGTVVGGTCVCPANTTRQSAGTNAFRCVGTPPPTIVCTGGSVINGTCVCPTNTTRQSAGTNAFRCVGTPPPTIVCTGGSVIGGTCVCPANTTRQSAGANAFRCVGQQTTTQIVCTGGTVVGKTCVCPANTTRQAAGANAFRCVSAPTFNNNNNNNTLFRAPPATLGKPN